MRARAWAWEDPGDFTYTSPYDLDSAAGLNAWATRSRR